MIKVRLLLVILLTLSTAACTSKYPPRTKSDTPAQSTESPNPSQVVPPQSAEPSPPIVTIPDQPKEITEEVQPPTPTWGLNQTIPTPPAANWQAPQVQRSVEDSLQAVAGAKPELSVSVLPSGEPVLEIRYPWSEFSRPSIQMAWTENEAGVAGLKPIALDDVRAEALWQKEIGRIDQPKFPGSLEPVKTTLSFLERKDGKPISLRAGKNSLGKAAGYAADESAGSSLVFYLLNSWGDETGSLKFVLGDLEMATKLAKPGKVQVWFLSQEQPVWDATVDWPGKQPAREVAQQPAASAPEMPSPQMPDAASNLLVAPGAEASSPSGPDGLSVAPTLEPPTSPVDTGTPAPAPNPGETVVASPAAQPQPAKSEEPTPATKPDFEKMSIDELAGHIEKQYGATMSPVVRKYWVGGLNNYYRSKNPLPVRRSVFMDLLRSAYDEKPPVELRQALRALFFKLDADQRWASSKGR
jgi:hypothetical protein